MAVARVVGFRLKKCEKEIILNEKHAVVPLDLNLLATSGSDPRGVAGGAYVVGGCYGVEGKFILNQITRPTSE